MSYFYGAITFLVLVAAVLVAIFIRHCKALDNQRHGWDA